MMVGNPRRAAVMIVRLAEPAGVRELQTHEQAVERAERGAMGILQLVEQRGQAAAVRLRGERLIGIGPPVGPHGRRFAAPNQFRPAEAEIPPPPQHMLRRRAVAIGVPAFHRMDAPAIADLKPGHRNRRGQRRTVRC